MKWALACVVVAAVIGAVLFLPVILGGSHRAVAVAPAADTPIPVGALGGLGLSVVLSARMALARRGGHRRDHD